MRALGTRKGRAESGRFVAEGVRVVEDLLESDLRVLWVANSSSLEDDERGAALLDRIDRAGVARRAATDREFEKLALTESPQGVLAVAEIPRHEPAALAVGRAPAVVLVLDGVQDPGNFGTLTRSAEALGAAGVVSLPGTVDAWNPKAVRAAAGSLFRIPVLQMSLAEAVAELRRRDFRLLGADASGEPVSGARGDRLALVVGNEGGGLSREVVDALDGLVAVPLRGRAESLNVAAAAAILLYELTRVP